jgi:hypothetical protein
MSWFTPKQPQQNQQQQPQGGGNGNPQQSANNQQQQMPNNGQNNGGNPNDPNANPNTPKNPLDIYGKMFDNPANPDAPPSFAIDPKVMDSVVSGQDFMQGVDPDLLQKAQSGDTQSLLNLIQHTTRNAYRAAIEHGGVLTDKFVGARMEHGNKNLPNRVREELTAHELSNTPNFKHPVVKKQLTEIAKRLQTLHPDAAPQEIASMARDYLTEMANAIKDTGNENGNQQASKETNWDEFFNEDANS